jgi:hypothetical protein
MTVLNLDEPCERCGLRITKENSTWLPTDVQGGEFVHKVGECLQHLLYQKKVLIEALHRISLWGIPSDGPAMNEALVAREALAKLGIIGPSR